MVLFDDNCSEKHNPNNRQHLKAQTNMSRVIPHDIKLHSSLSIIIKILHVIISSLGKDNILYTDLLVCEFFISSVDYD